MSNLKLDGIPVFKDKIKEDFQEIPGFHRAKVINNHDPNDDGAIEIHIPFMMTAPELQNETLWAYPAFHWGGFTDGKEYGCFLVPPKDSYVWVFFEGNDRSRPVYFAGVTLRGTKKTEPQAENESENVFVLFKTPNKHKMYVSDNKNTITIETEKGHVFNMDDDNKVVTLKTTDGRILILDDNLKKISITTGKHSINMDNTSLDLTITAEGGQVVTLKADGGIDVSVQKDKVIKVTSDIVEFTGVVKAKSIDVTDRIQTNIMSASSYEPKAPPTQ